MKIKVRMLWVLAAAFVSLFSTLNAPAASADTIVYQVTGEGTFAGTSFTFTTDAYLAPSFMVAPDAGAVVDYAASGTPTSAGTLMSINGTTTYIDLVTSGDATLTLAAPTPVYPTSPVSNFVIKDNGVETALVTVTDTPTPTPAPEPGVGSLVLIGLGSLGLLMMMRKRIARGFPQAA